MTWSETFRAKQRQKGSVGSPRGTGGILKILKGKYIGLDLSQFTFQYVRINIPSNQYFLHMQVKGAGGSADLKISKSALLFLNHHNFSNTELI